jgi:hypothetical protein
MNPLNPSYEIKTEKYCNTTQVDKIRRLMSTHDVDVT